MNSTSRQLSNYEQCARRAFYGRQYHAPYLTDLEFLHEALTVGVIATEGDFGELAGQKIMDLGESPGLDSKFPNVYDQCIHLATLADILTHALRKPQDAPWEIPASQDGWNPNGFLAGDGTLRRICLVSSYNEERHFAEMRSWYTLGEVCAYRLPMKIAFLVIGQNKNGRRHGPFSKGFRHPQNKMLRFRKKSASTASTFSDKWLQVWREDVDDVPTMRWLQAMYSDDILRDVAFSVDVPVPPELERVKIWDMARRKLEKIEKLIELPDKNLSTCDWPNPCPFRIACHFSPERTPEKAGFQSILTQVGLG